METTQAVGVKRPQNQIACLQYSTGTKVDTYHIMADMCHFRFSSNSPVERAKRDKAAGLAFLRFPPIYEWPGREGAATTLRPPKQANLKNMLCALL